MHGMTSGTITSKAVACQLANQFINQNLGYYNDLLSGAMSLNSGGHRGKNLRNTRYNPYFRLGMAMHTVMDSTSPAHQGYQYWELSQTLRHGSETIAGFENPHTEESLSALLANPALIN